MDTRIVQKSYTSSSTQQLTKSQLGSINTNTCLSTCITVSVETLTTDGHYYNQILTIRERKQSQQPTISGTTAKLTAGTTHQNNQSGLCCYEQRSAANTMA